MANPHLYSHLSVALDTMHKSTIHEPRFMMIVVVVVVVVVIVIMVEYFKWRLIVSNWFNWKGK